MIGQTISHYRILSQLGEGGMGVVYMAEDTLLGRQVAIKTLTDGGLGRQHFRTRFLREARAVSALSHANIATIHEYGETDDGQPYIVMELVKGQTLADLINESKLTVERAIEITIDVAKALGEAHRHGIIHRDIKPSNIAINENGQVKVLDFGLAKRVEPASANNGNPEAKALLHTQTREGVIVGTPMYVSPEQAMGIPVDARSDLFSLGSVLYECIAGGPAFSGFSAIEICAKVIRDDPPEPSRSNPSVSAELDRITLKTLAKRAEDRYRSADELIADLQTVALPLRHDAKRVPKPTQRLAIATSPTVGTATETVNLGRRSLIALIACALLGIIFLSYFLLSRKRPLQLPAQLELTRLAITGTVREAAISPDGKYVAAIIDEAGSQSLLLRQTNTGRDLQIIEPAAAEYKGISFSPDGDYIYYLKREGDAQALYRVSVLGGASQKLTSNLETPVTFSPQSDRFAFVRYQASTHSTLLIISNPDGLEERILATLTEPQFFSRGGFYSSGPEWSPDASVIAVPSYSITDNSHRDVVVVRVSDGLTRTLNTQKWAKIEKLGWLSDGSGLLMNASDQQSSPLQIWLLSYPDGQTRRITSDPNYYIGLSITKDSNALLTTKVDSVSALWIKSGNPDLPAEQVSSSNYIGRSGLSWVPDGSLVFSSDTSGAQNIWMMSANGSNRRQLTFDDHENVEPSVSLDGRYIAFVSHEGRHPHVWRMDQTGGNLKQLTGDGDEDLPRFTPDSKSVVYHCIENGRYSVRRISVDGGEPVILTQEEATEPDVSPDGKLVACFSRARTTDSEWSLTVLPTGGGSPVKQFNLPAGVNPEWPGVRWTPDGLALSYVATSQGVSNIWSQPLLKGPATPLTNFKESRIFNFAWSPISMRLAFVRGTVTKDVYLIKGFRNAGN